MLNRLFIFYMKKIYLDFEKLTCLYKKINLKIYIKIPLSIIYIL